MSYLTFRLLDRRSLLKAKDDRLQRVVRFTGHLYGDEEISAADGDAVELLSHASIEFASSDENSLAGSVTYSERWHSDEDNVTYPGSIAVALELASGFITFIDTPRLGEEFFLTIRIDAANQAFFHMGPHGNGEWHWDPKRQNPIAASVHELGYAPGEPIA